MNTPVSFEIAKLLKEKGFDAYCNKKYIAQCLWQKPNSRENYKNSEIHKNSSDVAAPTIAEVVMWLYEKYGIWVRIHPVNYNYLNPSMLLKKIEWCFVVSKIKDIDIKWEKEGRNNSPTEAYEAAIEYTLKNLI